MVGGAGANMSDETVHTITVAFLGILAPLIAVLTKRLSTVAKRVNHNCEEQRTLIRELRAELTQIRKHNYAAPRVLPPNSPPRKSG